MSKWSICKSFSFCYGHRVWVQELNSEYSLNGKCKCRGKHGHEGEVVIHLTSNVLNDQSMVFDFVNLNFFKRFLDTELDHKMIYDIHDPSLNHFYPRLQDSLELKYYDDTGISWSIVNVSKISDLPVCVIEGYESLVLVDFVPTSENLSKWLFEIVQQKLTGYAIVEKVEFWETPKSCSTYSL